MVKKITHEQSRRNITRRGQARRRLEPCWLGLGPIYAMSTSCSQHFAGFAAHAVERFHGGFADFVVSCALGPGGGGAGAEHLFAG